MKTVALIQARLGSTRFPRKALADFGGRPLLAQVFRAAQQIRGVDQVVVLTVPEDALEIAQALAVEGARVVAPYGVAEADVLGRFAAYLSQDMRAQTVVRLTGDCPCLDPEVCSDVVALQRTRGGYAWTDTALGVWPDGYDCEVMSRHLVLEAHRATRDAADREHVTPWIRRRASVVASLAPVAWPEWPGKVSVDTPEDLARALAWWQRQRHGRMVRCD